MRMHAGSLRQIPDDVLLTRVQELVRVERGRTVELLVHLAESDRRGLFRDAGFPSLYRYCHVGLGMSEDAALRRIRVARAVRRFPGILEMIEDGRHHLSSVALLAPYLRHVNATELLRTTERFSNHQVRLLIAARFPKPDVPTVIQPIVPPPTAITQDVRESSCQLGPDPVGPGATNETESRGPVADLPAPPGCAPYAPPPPYTRVAPLSPARYALQCTLSAAVHAKLREVQDLLGPRISPSDISQVLDLALDALIERLERTRRAALRRPEAAGTRTGTTASPVAAPGREAVARAGRYIPRAVRRAVWARDAGRCRFVSATGRRCESRSGLEIDHVRPVSLGGTNEAGNLRLLCRAHNQLEAERRLGAAFMGAKRAARAAAAP